MTSWVITHRLIVMPKVKFSDFMHELEAEAKAEGPRAVEELETFREYFRLAKDLAEARRAKGLSQQQLAEKCDIHQSEISDIERGRANPTFRTLQAIARGLDCRIALLARGPRASARKSSASSPTRSRRKASG